MGVLLLCPNSGYAFEPTFRGFFEAGNKSTIEAIEGTSILDYDYAKYYLRYKYPIKKPLNLTLVYNSYAKKYEDRKELNNNTISIKSYWDYSLFVRKDSSLKFDVDLGWREKKYKYKEKDVYTNSQWMLKLKSTYKIEDLWSLSGELGYKDYDYFLSEGKDRREFSERVEGKRYFSNKRVQFLALVNFRQTDFDSEPDTNQFIYRLGVKVRPELSFLSEMAGRIEEGKKYTDEDIEEEQEGDLYFKYRRWWLKTEHPVLERMYTVLKYTDYNKDYTTVDADYDYRWYEIENRWRYIVLKNPVKRLSLTFSYLHRETDYSQRKISSYDKDSVEMGAQYSWRNNWKALLKFGIGFYNYTIGREKDKKTYSMAIEFEKEIITRKLALAVEYKWKLKDYELKPDVTQNAGRISIDYKF